MNDEKVFDKAIDFLDVCDYFTSHHSDMKRMVDGFVVSTIGYDPVCFTDATIDSLNNPLNIAFISEEYNNIHVARKV